MDDGISNYRSVYPTCQFLALLLSEEPVQLGLKCEEVFRKLGDKSDFTLYIKEKKELFLSFWSMILLI